MFLVSVNLKRTAQEVINNANLIFLLNNITIHGIKVLWGKEM